MLELCNEFVTSFRIYIEVNSLTRKRDGGGEGGGASGDGGEDLTRMGGVLGCDVSTTLSDAAVRRLKALHRDFARTNRFLLLLLKSFVKRSHGAAPFLEDLLVRMDFSQFYLSSSTQRASARQTHAAQAEGRRGGRRR